MKKDIADAWIRALRSGKYVQGEGGLKRQRESGVKYCCLGVLCEILGTPEDPHKDSNGYSFFEGFAAYPPESVQIHAELKFAEGRIEGTGLSLSRMNDSGATFGYIADVIEQNWEEL